MCEGRMDADEALAEIFPDRDSDVSSLSHRAGLKTTAGQRTMSGQNDDLFRQNFGSPVVLTGHVQDFQINNTKKNIRSIS